MLFKEATTYVCVYIYISRTREKKEIVLFLGSLPPLPSSFQECEFYNHASLCTSLIRFIFIGYRFPPSPLRHFYAIREIRVRETTRSSTEIFLCTINILLSFSLVRSATRTPVFTVFLLPPSRSVDLSSKGKIQSRLSVSRSIYRGSSGRSRSSPIHARFEGRSGWRVLDLVGGERSGRERNAKGRRGAREGYARRGSLEK